MKKLFLLIIFLSFNVFASELENECKEVVKKYQNLPSDESFKKALDYRENYFDKEKDKEAFCILSTLSKQGYVDADATLAMFYTDNTIFHKELKKAFEMTEEAAKKGSILAVNNLGVIYFNGVYVNVDFTKAISYYKEAIEKGYPIAKIGLSYAYFIGQGVPQDTNKAIELALEVAKDPNRIGYETAMTNLGVYYGAIGNKKEQLYWTEKAAEQYDPSAQVNLGNLYATDRAFLNKEKALYWLNKAIERGNPQAYFALGKLYEKGSPVFEVNNEKAMELYLKSAELGNDKAQYYLGSKLFHNHQEKEALKWFLIAATEQNNPNSIVSLYQIYSQGTKDIPKDPEKAQYWLDKAKELGFVPAP